MKIYLASPFFNDIERAHYDKVISILRKKADTELFVPQEHIVPGADTMPNADWALEVFKMDVEALEEAELVIVLNWGLYSDSGTAWEQGYAFARGKEVLCILMDETPGVEYSLMTVNGCLRYVFYSVFTDPESEYDLEVLQK